MERPGSFYPMAQTRLTPECLQGMGRDRAAFEERMVPGRTRLKELGQELVSRHTVRRAS